LRERLFEQFDTVILTSATLTVGGASTTSGSGWALTTRRTARCAEFDFPNQALLYLPRQMPDVRDAGSQPKPRMKS